MPGSARSPADREIGEELADWGKVVLLETRGRATGRAVRTPVGFIEGDDGSLLVAASDAATHWARNLRADPRCRVTLEGTTSEWIAHELGAAEHDAVVVALILRYGTPAERLGAGPAFQLRAASPRSGA